jgi:hypothetical protein
VRPIGARIVAIVLASTLAIGAAAEELTPDFITRNGDVRVSRVVYAGNARTQDAAIAELTGIEAGMPLSDIDIDAAKQNVLKSGIFSEVDLTVDAKDGGAVVTVSVKEKWTLIPVPSGYYGSGGWSAGLDLVELNFLGLRRTLVIGGSDSNLGLSGTIAYIDPRFLHTKTAFKAFSSYGRDAEEARYMDGASYAAFDMTTADAGIYAEYPSEGRLRADIELTLRYTGISAADVASNAGLYDATLVLVPGAGIAYDGQRFSEYRETGPTASATYAHGFSFRDMPSYDIVSLSAEEKFGAFLDGVADIGLEGRYGSRSFQALGPLSGSGYRTLPQGCSYSGKNLALYSALELPFVKAGWCVMTGGAFYEGGIYATGLKGDTVELFHGPGISYRLYLHDVAVPAIGIDVAYNVPVGIFVFSANVGLSL